MQRKVNWSVRCNVQATITHFWRHKITATVAMLLFVIFAIWISHSRIGTIHNHSNFIIFAADLVLRHLVWLLPIFLAVRVVRSREFFDTDARCASCETVVDDIPQPVGKGLRACAVCGANLRGTFAVVRGRRISRIGASMIWGALSIVWLVSTSVWIVRWMG